MVVVLYAMVDGAFLVSSVRSGSVFGAVVGALLASTVPMAVVAAVLEPRSLVTHIRAVSYAFVFGDKLFLPFSAAMAALAWRSVPKDDWRVSWWWTSVSVGVGVLAGLVFRFLIDGPTYAQAGAMGSFAAPTKYFHDLGAYPVLFGSLFCVGVPLFVRTVDGRLPFLRLYAAPELWLFLLGIGLWLAVSLWHDSGLFGHPPLDPRNLHPNDWVWPRVSVWDWLGRRG